MGGQVEQEVFRLADTSDLDSCRGTVCPHQTVIRSTQQGEHRPAELFAAQVEQFQHPRFTCPTGKQQGRLDFSRREQGLAGV